MSKDSLYVAQNFQENYVYLSNIRYKKDKITQNCFQLFSQYIIL